MSTTAPSDDNAASASATSNNVDMETQSSNATSSSDTGNASASTVAATSGNEPRLIEGRWVCQKGDAFLEYIDDQWKPVEAERLPEVSAKYMLAVPASNNDASTNRLVDGVWVRPDPQNAKLLIRYVDEAWSAVPEEELPALREKYEALDPFRRTLNGVKLVWNPAVQQWLPDGDVNEDFIAHYQSCYGVSYDYSKLPESEKERKLKEAEAKTKAKLERKKVAEEAAASGQKAEAGWTEIGEDKNTNVYVSGLPTSITEEEFIEFMSKAGVIMKDPRTNKRKFKLYKNPDGSYKGDGICCYVMMESVALACDILDGWDLNGSKVHVERAKFEMKGSFDPSKKKRKLTADQKKKFLESQKKTFEWVPDKPRNYRPVSDCTVILKNVFGRDEMLADVTLALDLKTQVQEACTRFGTVKKVVVYENHPDGVVSVTFPVVEESDYCVKLMDRGIFRHREISAALWDGKTKYKVEESEADQKARDAGWEAFLGHEDDEDDDHESDDEAPSAKKPKPSDEEPIESTTPADGQE
uniref:17S U2 SnRNP complex component HTATSF1 n=1 Tax=Panagrellus redivivus TaxID=6233 RepID=A0A7E4WDU1_PANRE